MKQLQLICTHFMQTPNDKKGISKLNDDESVKFYAFI